MGCSRFVPEPMHWHLPGRYSATPERLHRGRLFRPLPLVAARAILPGSEFRLLGPNRPLTSLLPDVDRWQ